jgi:predicted outer membrane repeat protein
MRMETQMGVPIINRRKPNLITIVTAVALMAVATLAAMLFVLLSPSTAFADDGDDVAAHSIDRDGNKTSYSSISDALTAGYGGDTIIMDADWDFGEKQLEVEGGKSLTIDMNGHSITGSKNTSTIYLNERASLKLTSSAKEGPFFYLGYVDASGVAGSLSIATGGLVINSGSGKGIWMDAYANVTLENIAVVGCCGGGIYAKSNGSIVMTNASVCHNSTAKSSSSSEKGGAGIYLGASSKLSMNSSHIDSNHCTKHHGGGIYAEKAVTIEMENHSTVNGNEALAGGGIYFYGTSIEDSDAITLKSQDRTGVIAWNTCTRSVYVKGTVNESGGGIHVAHLPGLIEGLTIEDNYSAYDSGGIELGGAVTVRDCTITGNRAQYDAGGIYVNSSGAVIESSVITDNYCNSNGGSYEGGGIFVSYHYDIEMKGKCIIKGNTRGRNSGNADDVFLSTISGGAGKAYITGSLSKGSTVGVRTGITDDRRIAKSFKPETKDCLFINLDGYYVSYGNDEGGDAWQRHSTIEFAVKINGEIKARYKQGTSVTLVAPATKGDDQVFWYWDADFTTGLNPVEDYITDSGAFNNTLTFTMPQNDVDASAIYATRATSVIVGIYSPVAGQQLPTSAELHRTDGTGESYIFPTTVTWYEVNDDGTKTVASGTAKSGTTYAASISCAQSIQGGLYFSKSMSVDDVTVMTDAGASPVTESASIDDATGTLTVTTGMFARTDGERPGADSGRITVELRNGGLGAASGEASAVSATALAEDDVPSTDADGAIREYEVSYASDSDSVTFSAPALDGYNFCYWDLEDPSWEHDDVAGTLTIPAYALDGGLRVVAVYTPVVTGAEFAAAAPLAAGDKLADSVPSLRVECSDGSELDFAELLGSESLPVTWSPEGEDGKADFSTTYTAMVKIMDDADDLVDVDKVLGANAVVTASNGTEADGAGFAVIDGTLYLCVSFPRTPDVKATSVSQPADVELTFEQALGYQTEQESHPDEICWPLPETVTVTLENGKTTDGDVTWEVPTGFDANAAAAQEIAVKGTVRVAYEGDVDVSGVSLDVSSTMRIAAPGQSKDDADKTDDKDTDKTDGKNTGKADGGNSAGGKATGGTSSSGKSALAKTGVSVLMTAAAIAAIAAAAIGIVALRSRRD